MPPFLLVPLQTVAELPLKVEEPVLTPHLGQRLTLPTGVLPETPQLRHRPKPHY